MKKTFLALAVAVTAIFSIAGDTDRTVNIDKSGLYRVAFRYSGSAVDGRQVDIYLDDVRVSSFAYPERNGVWYDHAFTNRLETAGEHTIRFAGTGDDAGTAVTIGDIVVTGLASPTKSTLTPPAVDTGKGFSLTFRP